MHRRLNERDVHRRIEFLIHEASIDDPIRDQSVIFTQRAISNFYCVGRDCQSPYIKKHARHRSVEAHALAQTDPEWLSKVTNEHQEQLRDVWHWMCEARGRISLADVAARLKKWPMVALRK
jgi:hypothetical protein